MQAIECTPVNTTPTARVACITTDDNRTLCGAFVGSTLPLPAGASACTLCAGVAQRRGLVVCP